MKTRTTIFLKQTIGFVTFLILSACTSPRLYVESEPVGAEVFVSNPGSREIKSLGKAPLSLSFTELNKAAKRSEGDYNNLVVLTVKGKDLETQRILVPLVTVGLKSVDLKILLEKGKDDNNSAVVLQHLHNAQKFAQSGEFERAHIECDKVLEIDPQIIRAISTKASLFYVQKKLEASLIWYEKALALDPSFDEAVMMIAKIKQERK